MSDDVGALDRPLLRASQRGTEEDWIQCMYNNMALKAATEEAMLTSKCQVTVMALRDTST